MTNRNDTLGRLAEALAWNRLEAEPLGNEGLLRALGISIRPNPHPMPRPPFDSGFGLNPALRFDKVPKFDETPQQPQMPLPATEEQKPKRHFNPRRVEPRDGDPLIDAVSSLVSGAVKGVVGIAGLPGDLEGLARLGVNFAGKRILNRSEALVDENPAWPTSQRSIEIAGQYIPLHTPKTKAGRYAEAFGENALALIGPGGPLRALVRVAVPAVAGQTAHELAPEPYKDLAKAFVGVGAGHYAGIPYTAKGRTDELLAPLATQYAQNQLRKFGPDAFLFEATNKFSPWANHAVQQNNSSSQALLRAVADRADKEFIRVGRTTRPGNFDNRVAEIEQRFAKTHDQFPPTTQPKLPRNVEAVSNHPIFEVLPKFLERRLNDALPAALKQRMQNEIATRLGLRGSEAVDELQRLKHDHWLRKLESWVSLATDARDPADGTYQSMREQP